MRGALVLAVALLVVGCPRPPPPPVTPPAADAGTPDAAPAPAPAATCGPATSHRQQLGCAGQENFLALCLNVNDQRFSDCVAAAPSCAAMDGCDPALLAGAKRARR